MINPSGKISIASVGDLMMKSDTKQSNVPGIIVDTFLVVELQLLEKLFRSFSFLASE